MSEEQEAPDAPARTFGGRFVVTAALVAALLGGAVGYLASPGTTSTAGVSKPTPLAPPVQLKLGETGVTETGGHVTVLTWSRGTPPGGWPAPEDGYEYSRAEVRFCAGEGTWNFRIREVPYLFNLVDTSGNLIDPQVDVSYSLDELASYNVGLISPNDCITGSIIFVEEKGQPIRAIRFTGRGRFEWDLSAISAGSPAPSPQYDFGSAPFAAPSPSS